MQNSKRWGIAAAGFILQTALGAVYAWSVFRFPSPKVRLVVPAGHGYVHHS